MIHDLSGKRFGYSLYYYYYYVYEHLCMYGVQMCLMGHTHTHARFIYLSQRKVMKWNLHEMEMNSMYKWIIRLNLYIYLIGCISWVSLPSIYTPNKWNEIEAKTRRDRTRKRKVCNQFVNMLHVWCYILLQWTVIPYRSSCTKI